MLHCTYQKHPLNIGNNVSIGHNAIVHGCTIKDNVLIGMGAIVMDDCLVEENSIVGAGSVVTQEPTSSQEKSGVVYRQKNQGYQCPATGRGSQQDC